MRRADILQKLVAIVGPTAVGKSALAVKLARTFHGEVISADSRQIYRGLDIGTGKITEKEMRGIPHHMLDIANSKKRFSASEYQALARKKIGEVFGRGKLPIIVGGTGLYIQAVVNDAVFPKVLPNRNLRTQLEKKTKEQLFFILKKIDARRAKTIDAQNPRRLVRAIEIATALGKVPPYQNVPRKDIDALFVGLTLPHHELKKRIAARLAVRMNEGMVKEAEKLHGNGLSWKRMEELGLEYRYTSRYLRGLISKKEMLEKLQSEIWHYAKRQMTWFKRNRRILWFKPNEKQKIGKTVRKFIST